MFCQIHPGTAASSEHFISYFVLFILAQLQVTNSLSLDFVQKYFWARNRNEWLGHQTFDLLSFFDFIFRLYVLLNFRVALKYSCM